VTASDKQEKMKGFTSHSRLIKINPQYSDDESRAWSQERWLP